MQREMLRVHIDDLTVERMKEISRKERTKDIRHGIEGITDVFNEINHKYSSFMDLVKCTVYQKLRRK